MNTTLDPTPLGDIDLDREPLTAADRCDACGAQAYVAATVTGIELMYCAHHAGEYEQRLCAAATSWHDQRSDLYPKNRP